MYRSHHLRQHVVRVLVEHHERVSSVRPVDISVAVLRKPNPHIVTCKNQGDYLPDGDDRLIAYLVLLLEAI